LAKQAQELFLSGKNDAAMRLVDQALAVSPQTALLHFVKAGCLDKNGNHDTALQEIDIALILDKNDKKASSEDYQLQGNILLSFADKQAEALKSLDEAVKLNPGLNDRDGFHVFRGRAFFGLKETHAALTEFNLAIELNPDSASAHREKGMLLWAMGRNDEALAELGTAARINPDDKEAIKAIGDIQRKPADLPASTKRSEPPSPKTNKVVTGYCVYERKNGMEIKNPRRIKWKNGRHAIRGICGSCGKPIFRIVAKEKP